MIRKALFNFRYPLTKMPPKVSTYRVPEDGSVVVEDPSGTRGPLTVHAIEGTIFWPEIGIAESNGTVLPETIPDEAWRRIIVRDRLHRAYPVEGVSGAATSIGDVYASNYYHRWIDMAPKVWVLAAIANQFAPVTLYLTRGQFAEHEMPLLRALLPAGVEVREVERRRRIKSDCYLYLSRVRIPGGADPAMPHLPAAYFSWFKSKTYAAFNIPDEEPWRRIYISRRRATVRRLTNEVEVSAYLERQGFETIELETLTLSEQAHLFASASRIVAQHGAGLTNLLYARPAAPIIEIHQTPRTWDCYGALQQSLGLGRRVIQLDAPSSKDHAHLPLHMLESILEDMEATQS